MARGSKRNESIFSKEDGIEEIGVNSNETSEIAASVAHALRIETASQSVVREIERNERLLFGGDHPEKIAERIAMLSMIVDPES